MVTGGQHHHHHANVEAPIIHPEQLVTKRHLLQLATVLVLTLGYAIVEWWGSATTHSVALLADAGHMVADASGLILALLGGAFSLVAQKANANGTAKKIERIATILNALGLVGLSIYLWWTGIEQLAHPKIIDPMGLLWIAGGGFVVNLIAAGILHSGQQNNLNIKGAYLHVMFDLLGSVAAMVSAVIILTSNVYWVDPALSLIVALLISITTWQFLKLALNPNEVRVSHGCGHHH